MVPGSQGVVWGETQRMGMAVSACDHLVEAALTRHPGVDRGLRRQLFRVCPQAPAGPDCPDLGADVYGGRCSSPRTGDGTGVPRSGMGVGPAATGDDLPKGEDGGAGRLPDPVAVVPRSSVSASGGIGSWPGPVVCCGSARLHPIRRAADSNAHARGGGPQAVGRGQTSYPVRLHQVRPSVPGHDHRVVHGVVRGVPDGPILRPDGGVAASGQSGRLH